MTDPIADMLTRIRNAYKVKKREVYIPFSKIKLEVLKILKRQNYIEGFEEIKPGVGEYKFGGILVKLKYEDSKSVITSIKKISKPGRRVYVTKDNIPQVLNGLGMAIMSTSEGVVTGEEAVKKGLGGEVICEVY